MEEGARKAVTGDICRDSHSERVLLRKLYEEIPQKGDLGYESENMDPCRGDIDALSDLVLSNSGLSGEWERLKKRWRSGTRRPGSSARPRRSRIRSRTSTPRSSKGTSNEGWGTPSSRRS
jgi:hypothetical protein